MVTQTISINQFLEFANHTNKIAKQQQQQQQQQQQ
jgi:hypothetical protein